MATEAQIRSQTKVQTDGQNRLSSESFVTLPRNDFNRNGGMAPNAFNSRDFRYTREEVIALQTGMKALGYDLGNYGPNRDGADGVAGRAFHLGLMRFASEHGNLRFNTKADLGATMEAVVRGNAPAENPAAPARTAAPSVRVMPTAQIDERALAQAREHLISREGYRRTAYYDSEGHLTIGIGHKVTPADNIRPGQTISAARVEQLFRQDMQRSFSAAQVQARQANCYTPDMICALTSVNFQLGTGWNRDFRRAWGALRRGDFNGAIEEIYNSDWATQTRNRVDDFARSIRGHATSLASRGQELLNDGYEAGRGLVNGATTMGRNLWEGGRNLLEQTPLGRIFGSNAERGYSTPDSPAAELAANTVKVPGFRNDGVYQP